MTAIDKNAMDAFSDALSDAVLDIADEDQDLVEETDDYEEEIVLKESKTLLGTPRPPTKTKKSKKDGVRSEWVWKDSPEATPPMARSEKPHLTGANKFEIGEVVQMRRDPGAFFKIRRVPADGDTSKTYQMYGGRSGRGGVLASVRDAYETDLIKVESKSMKSKAEKSMRAIYSALSQAPKAHWRANGKK